MELADDANCNGRFENQHLPPDQTVESIQAYSEKESSLAHPCVTEVRGGLYVTPESEPTERELREVIAAAGSLGRRQTHEDEVMVRQVIADYRRERRRKR